MDAIRWEWGQALHQACPSAGVIVGVGLDCGAFDEETAREALAHVRDSRLGGHRHSLEFAWKLLCASEDGVEEADRCMESEVHRAVVCGKGAVAEGRTCDDACRVPQLVLLVDVSKALGGREDGKDSAGVHALPLRMGWSCRLERECGWSRCASLVFCGLSGRSLRRSLREVAKQGIFWGGRKWEVVHAKVGERRVRVVASSGPGLVEMPPGSVLEWHAPKSALLGEQTALKRASRADLMLSSASPGLFVDGKRGTATVVGVPDVVSRSGKVMTDGCAPISIAAMREVVETLQGRAPQGTAWGWVGDEKRLPAALQGRFGGHKGVWLVDVRLSGVQIGVRPSQRKIALFQDVSAGLEPVEPSPKLLIRKRPLPRKKTEGSSSHPKKYSEGAPSSSSSSSPSKKQYFEGDSSSTSSSKKQYFEGGSSSSSSPSKKQYLVGDSSSSKKRYLEGEPDRDSRTPTQQTLEVLRFSAPPAPATTHWALLALLLAWGCPGDVLQRRIAERSAFLRRALHDTVACREVLLECGRGATVDEVAATNPRSRVGRAAALVAAGLEREPSVPLAAYTVARAELEGLRDRGALNLRRSCSLLLVPDPTASLKPGEVFIRFSAPGKYVPADGVLRGSVLVARSPCHAVGDLRAWTAVDLPAAFTAFRDCLMDVCVLPVRGDEPAASFLAGGDYDGDLAWICYDRDIADPIHRAQKAASHMLEPTVPPKSPSKSHSPPPVPLYEETSPSREPLRPKLLPPFSALDLETPIKRPQGDEEQATSGASEEGLTPELCLAAWLRSLSDPEPAGIGQVTLSLGLAANLHLAWADCLLERHTDHPQLAFEHPAWEDLAYASRALVDAPKTGATVSVDEELANVPRPHFLPSSRRLPVSKVRVSKSPLAGICQTAAEELTKLDSLAATHAVPKAPTELIDRAIAASHIFPPPVTSTKLIHGKPINETLRSAATAVFRAAVNRGPGRAVHATGDSRPTAFASAAFEDEAADEVVATVAAIRRSVSATAARKAFVEQAQKLAETLQTTLPPWTNTLPTSHPAIRQLHHATNAAASHALAATCYLLSWEAATQGHTALVPTRHWDTCLEELLLVLKK